MGFNEKVHAFIAACYYQELKKAFDARGVRAFVHATQYYASTRGRRMAQRAIRDGKDLSFDSYLGYGEWVNTEEIKKEGVQNQSTVTENGPDFVRKITVCPWHTQFSEMGEIEGGHEYCEHLDNSICRGFNPYIQYLVPQTLHKSEFCIHRITDTTVEGGGPAKDPANLRSFEYHCGHSYWAYNEVTAAIFRSEGEAVNQKVMQRFSEKYGREMADTLASYRWHNFNVAD